MTNNEPKAESRGSSQRYAPTRSITLLHVASLLIPLSAIILGCKAHKLFLLSDTISLRDFVALSANDITVLMLFGAFWTAALHFSRGLIRAGVVGCFHLLTLLLLIIALFEHGVFLVTGMTIDWEIIGYTMKNFSELRSVIASEITPQTWAILFAQVPIVILPFALGNLKTIVRLKCLSSQRSDWRRPMTLYLHIGFALLLLSSLYLGQLVSTSKLEMIRRNIFVDFVADAMLDMTSEDEVLSSIQPDKFAQLISAPPFQVIPTPARRHYNVVMIILESIRAQSTTLHNKDIDTTPFLSTFAKRGAFFENAYAVVDHTSKALVSIQCGISPKPGLPIDEANPGAIPTDCLAGILGKLGYATAFFQPADGSFERRAELANNFGFDLFVGRDDLPSKGFQKVSYLGYEDDILIEPALQWVAKQQKPFFLTMLTWTAHHNYQVPSTFQSRRFDENDKLNDYLTAIAYTDRFVKKFINGYEQLKIPEETLFIIASDHGQGFGEHKLWMHNGIMYEEGLRIPLILVGPGVEESGRSRQGLRQQIDILPTVMQVLGYEIKGSDLQGKSLLNARGHDQLLFSTWDLRGALGLRNGNIKFISYYGQRPMEIFDLAKDPLETQNLLYENDMLKQEGESVKKELEAWQTQNQVLYEISEARNQGRTKELFALKNRVRKHPKDLEARIQLANQLYELYFIDAAEQEYNRLLSMVTNKRQKSIVYFNLGLTLMRKKEPKVAVKHFESAVQGGFVHSELWNHIGLAYRDLGDIEKARAAFQRSISLNTRSINSAYNLGKMLLAIGDRHGAKAALKEAQLRHLQSTNRNILIGLLIDSGLEEAAE